VKPASVAIPKRERIALYTPQASTNNNIKNFIAISELEKTNLKT
jgi:hypothetical protein